MTPERAVEFAVRASYGRLLAILAARAGDLAAAEDALSDALLAALAQWPVRGVPARPEAWLVAVASRRLADDRRRTRVRTRDADAVQHHLEALAAPAETTAFPDRRLDLLFACAHPAIDVGHRTPLMLQVVLGLDATQVASAFLVAPATMAQRLVRAKRKIRDAGIAFASPEREELPARLAAALEAIYAAYGLGWETIDGGDAGQRDLSDEAMHLGELVVQAMPDAAEALGLLALMHYCEARRGARRDAAGHHVPLSRQDPSRMDHARIAQAESLLQRAARRGEPGRFQLEAAIQSAHIAPHMGHPPDPRGIAVLYDRLMDHAPTVAVLVNRAAAHGTAFGAAQGLTRLDELPAEAIATYQPAWALRAHLLAALGHPDAPAARQRAAGLTTDPAVRAFLLGGGEGVNGER